MNKSRFLYFLVGLGLMFVFGPLSWKSVQAQNAQFTQFQQALIQTNPALIGMSNQIQVQFNYRRQFIASGASFETPMVSLIYPWIKQQNKRVAAFGLSFIQDRTGEGGLLSTTGGLLTGAYNLYIGGGAVRKYQPILSFGLQAGFFQRRVNPDVLTSGSQWNGQTFEQALGLGESYLTSELFNASRGFPLFNAGVAMSWTDLCGFPKAYLGFSIQNLNQPNVAFFSENTPLPFQFSVVGGYSFYLQDRFILQPNLRWVQVEGSNEIRFGPMAYYLFGSGEGFVGEGSIGLGLWYDSNTDMAIGLEVNQPKFTIGFSYDLGAFGKQKELDGGAIELSLGFKFGKKCLSEGPPKDLNEIILDTTRLEVKSPVGDSIFTLVATIQKQEVISVDTIHIEFIPRDSDVLLIPTEDDLVVFKRKAFFYYISDDINKATAALLDEMAGIMSKFKGIRIKLAGHTCNIGASEADNEALAIRRAEAVKNYLSKKGIKPERIEIEGFGSSRPILSNKTEYGRIKNRRVEFEVLSTGASTD